MSDELRWRPSPPLAGGEEDFLEQMESHKSVGTLLARIGYSAVIFTNPKTAVNILKSDNIFFESLAKARENVLALFGDSSAESIYVGDKQEIQALYKTVEPGPVELILDEGKRFMLLSVTERNGSFVFSICPSEAPEQARLITVEDLNNRNPRPAF